MALINTIIRETGFTYSFHYLRYIQRPSKRDPRLLTARFRCPQRRHHCASSIVLSLESITSKNWTTVVNFTHTHEPSWEDEKRILERCSMMKKKFVKELLGFRSTVKVRKQDHWDTLYYKCFPCSPMSTTVNATKGNGALAFYDGSTINEHGFSWIRESPTHRLSPSQLFYHWTAPLPQPGAHVAGHILPKSVLRPSSTVTVSNGRVHGREKGFGAEFNVPGAALMPSSDDDGAEDEGTRLNVLDSYGKNHSEQPRCTLGVIKQNTDVTDVKEVGDRTRGMYTRNTQNNESLNGNLCDEDLVHRSIVSKPILSFNCGERSKVWRALSTEEAGEQCTTGVDMEVAPGDDGSEVIEQFLVMDDDEDIPHELLAVVDDDGRADGEKNTEIDAKVSSTTSYADSSITGEVEENKELDVHDVFKAAIIAYFRSLEVNEPGQNVKKEVRYISECLGYSLKCRTSIFLGEKVKEVDPGSGSLEDNRVLKKCILKCRKHCGTQLCNFSLTVKTFVPDEEEDGRCYAADFENAKHNHPPSKPSGGIKYLSSGMKSEALHMTNNLHMNLGDTVRFLSDKYGVPINIRSVRQMVRYNRSVANPKDLECTKLVETLVSLQEEDPQNKFAFTCDAQGRMTSACWALKEWIDDYKRFGVVPGVSVDCKAIANRYGFPLFTINGRANDGFTLIYFMGFMAGEREEDFVEMLSRFKSMIPISPSLIAMDQSMACISATERVFETSFICLDEWHLNKNQMKNVISWCATIKRPTWCDDMSRDLFNLRRFSSLSKFTKRRKEFQAKYFTPFASSAPSWYNFLYLQRPQLLIACFRIAAVPRLYLFQGTGYTESSNAGYRAYVLSKKVSFPAIPTQLKWMTSKRAAERNESRLRSMSPLSSRLRSIRDCEIPLPPEILDEMIVDYTNYALRKFKELSVMKSRNYLVSKASVLCPSEVHWPELSLNDEAYISSVACFELTWSIHLLKKVENPPPPERRFVKVLFARKEIESEDGGDSELLVRCDCQKSSSMGFPCRHIMRCAIVYSEIAERQPEIKEVLDDYIELHTFFDDYWKVNSEQFDYLHICERRKEARVLDMIGLQERLSNETGEGKECDEDIDLFLTRSSEQEVRTSLKWSDSQAMFDQIRRLTSGLGPLAEAHFQQALKTAIDTYSNGQLPSLTIFQNFTNDQHADQQRKEVRIVSGKIPAMKPPNKSNVRIVKRKRSFTERFNAKKTRAKGVDANIFEEMSQSQGRHSATLTSPNQVRSMGDRARVQRAVNKALAIIENPNNRS